MTPSKENVPSYLTQAILITVFCCLPFGIVAIVYAAQVNSRLEC
ncbi:MAG: CD225/dispanin family protein [Okeania sp. SIO3C4]|nr:CD225/dispanin family protein [Okeania sp. SIO3C4]